jgi:hypothetical protein
LCCSKYKFFIKKKK